MTAKKKGWPGQYRVKHFRPGFYDAFGQEAFNDDEADQLVERINGEIRARGEIVDPAGGGYGAWKVGPFQP